MLLGVHVSAKGSIYEAVDRAKLLDCNTMQIFARSPQRWRRASLDPLDVEEFNRRREKFRIRPLFIHMPYLVNLASPNPKLRLASIKAYIEDIQEADLLRAEYIVSHMGSHKNTSEEAGLRRFTDGLNKVLEMTSQAGPAILLENTAGSGSWLGYKFSHQRKVLEAVKDKKRVGFCLDTAHLYLAGYDISTQDGLESTLGTIEKNISLDKIKLIHLNDAKGKLNSKHDVHEHIGKGNIGQEGIQRIVNHPKLKDLAFILETPKDDADSDKINLALVRKLRRE